MAPSAPITSPLEHPPSRLADRPFFEDALRLLRAVRDHDFDSLATLCDDDFGIVDIDPAGQARVIRTRAEWETWFRELFATLDGLTADTDSEVLDYQAIATDDLGYSVLEFRQFLTVSGFTATFDCVATIVWKRTPAGWREARWHGSVISSDVPDELAALAN
ncbi:MAG: nuclear transport factor 2 family protein [Acidimicrobiales bacterium]